MRYSTGLTDKETADLYQLVEAEYVSTNSGVMVPPVLGLLEAMIIALRYLRTNHTQAEIGETIGRSQPTISRAITAVTPLLERALTHLIPVAEDVDLTQSVVIDGSLLPCWSNLGLVWISYVEITSVARLWSACRRRQGPLGFDREN